MPLKTLLLAFVTSLASLDNAAATGQSSMTTIKATVILPNNDTYVTSLSKVKPVLELASEAVRGILPDRRFQFSYFDDRCDKDEALKSAVEALCGTQMKNTHVIFGPTCEYCVAMVGRLVKFWSAPLITTGALTFDFAKPKTLPNSEFHMMIRVGLFDFATMAHAIVALLHRYEWSKVYLLYEKHGQSRVAGLRTCMLTMETLVEDLKEAQIVFRYYDLERKTFDSHREFFTVEIGGDFSRCRVYSKQEQLKTRFLPINLPNVASRKQISQKVVPLKVHRQQITNCTCPSDNSSAMASDIGIDQLDDILHRLFIQS